MHQNRRSFVRALVLSSSLSLLPFVACAPPSNAPPAKAAPGTATPTAHESTPRPPGKAAEADDGAIAKAEKEYLDLFVEIMPEQATALGLHKNDAELDDRTIAGFDQAVDREEAMAKTLRERFKSPRAGASAKTDLAMLIGALETDVRKKRVQRPLQRQPGVYTEPLEAIFQMTARDYAPAPDRARNVLARLEKIPKTIAAAKENLLNPPRDRSRPRSRRAAG